MFIAAKPRRFASARRAADVLCGPSELDEVEDAVLVVETQRGRLRLVHGRREGCRDALADEPDEVSVARRSRVRRAVLIGLRHEASVTSKSTVASDTLTGAEILSTSACAGWRL